MLYNLLKLDKAWCFILDKLLYNGSRTEFSMRTESGFTLVLFLHKNERRMANLPLK